MKRDCRYLPMEISTSADTNQIAQKAMESTTGRTVLIIEGSFYQGCDTEGESGRWLTEISTREST